MSEVKNIPRLRFPEFEEQWSEWLFSDFYDFQTTNSFSRDKLNYEEGDIYNLHYGDIHTKFRSQFILKSELVPFINSDVDTTKLKENNYLKEGDLVIADASEDYGDIGKTIEIIDTNNQKVVAGLHTLHAKSKNKFHIGFGSFLMKCPSSRKSFKMIAQGTKVLGISSSRVNQIGLTIPSLPEQQKIADFLTAVDKRIELLEKKKILLETYKIGVMKKIFNQEIQFKDDNGNDFPDWEEFVLNDLGKTLNGLTGKTKDDFDKGSCKYIQYKQVFGDSKIDPNGFGLVDVSANEKQTEIKYGDILFTTSSETPYEIGMSSVYMSKMENVYLNSFCFGFRPKSLNDLVPNFSRFLFRSDKVRSSIVKLAQGSTRYNMSKTNFLKIKVRIPSNKEQVKISEFLSSIDQQLELLGIQIDKSKTWKKGLLQKMFV